VFEWELQSSTPEEKDFWKTQSAWTEKWIVKLVENKPRYEGIWKSLETLHTSQDLFRPIVKKYIEHAQKYCINVAAIDWKMDNLVLGKNLDSLRNDENSAEEVTQIYQDFWNKTLREFSTTAKNFESLVKLGRDISNWVYQYHGGNRRQSSGCMCEGHD
jgi:hypothetical protein